MQQHLATHLQRIAIFALPSLADDSEDSAPGSADAIRNSHQNSTNVSGNAQAGDEFSVLNAEPKSGDGDLEEVALTSSSRDALQHRIQPSKDLTEDSLVTLNADFEREESAHTRVLSFVDQNTDSSSEDEDLNMEKDSRDKDMTSDLASQESARSDVATQGYTHWLPFVFSQSRPTTQFSTTGTEFVRPLLAQLSMFT